MDVIPLTPITAVLITNRRNRIPSYKRLLKATKEQRKADKVVSLYDFQIVSLTEKPSEKGKTGSCSLARGE